MKKLLSKYKIRLVWEAILNSLLGGIAAGAVFEFIFLAILHLLSHEPEVYQILLVASVPLFITSILLFFLKFYPSTKKVAARIDGTGLEERVGTMLELENESTYIAELQRKDAKEHLSTVAPKQIKPVIRKKSIIFSSVSLVLAISLMFIPYTIMEVFATAPDVNEEEAELIQNLLDELRKKVDEADVTDELKDKLDEVVDDLEDKLKEDGSTLDKAADISEAESKIEQILEDAVTKIKIGSALRQFESTEELGKAISKGDSDAVKTALSNMKEDFLSVTGEEQSDKLSQVSEDIKSALELSSVEAGDALYDALDKFSDALATSAAQSASDSDVTSDVESSVSTAESEIIAALEAQAKIEEAADEFGEMMDSAKDELFGNEPDESDTEDGEKPEGEQTEGEKPDGSEPDVDMPEGSDMPEGGDIPEGDMPGGDGSEGQSNMTEGIYDAYSGNVEYGELYAAYYAKYLAALDSGEVPSDLQEIIDQYFNSLNK